MPTIRVFAAAVCLLTTAANAQDIVNIPIDQASGVATEALFAGDTALALQIARAVLTQRPDDRAALMVVAVAAPQTGDAAEGRRAGARAWSLSRNDAQKYEAARVTALAAANQERFTLATFWLRRALTVAPDEQERARTINDARTIAQRNPWSTQLSFSLVPSDNVNGGAESADSSAPGNPLGGTLSEDALALTGWRATWALGTSYRFYQSETSRATAGLTYRGSRVWLTDNTDIPDDAFTTGSVEIDLSYQRALENGTIGVRVSRGIFEYRDLDFDPAGDDTTVSYDNYNVQRLQFDRRLSVNDTTLLSLSVSRDWLDYLSAGIGDVHRTTFGAGILYGLQNGDRIGLNASYTDSVGEDNVNYTSDSQTISASYSWGEPVGALSLSVGAGLSWSNYPDYRLLAPVTGGRQDSSFFYNVDIGFPQIEYAGFSPSLRLDRSVADSNVSRFDRSSYAINFGISSTF